CLRSCEGRHRVPRAGPLWSPRTPSPRSRSHQAHAVPRHRPPLWSAWQRSAGRPPNRRLVRAPAPRLLVGLPGPLSAQWCRNLRWSPSPLLALAPLLSSTASATAAMPLPSRRVVRSSPVRSHRASTPVSTWILRRAPARWSLSDSTLRPSDGGSPPPLRPQFLGVREPLRPPVHLLPPNYLACHTSTTNS